MTEYKITMVQQQKVLATPEDSGRDTGYKVAATAIWNSFEKSGEYFRHPLGWVGRWKAGMLALAYEIVGETEPPVDPPPVTPSTFTVSVGIGPMLGITNIDITGDETQPFNINLNGRTVWP